MSVLVALIVVIIVVLAVFVVLARVNRMAAAVFLAVTLGVAVWAFWIEPRSLVIMHRSMPIEGLAAPVRVVAIGDVQPIRPHWSAQRLERAFARAQAQNPDIVLWLGDYAYESGLFSRIGLGERVFVEPAEIIKAMATLEAPMGAYAILGNHDWWWDGPEVARLIRETHITLLIDNAQFARHPDTGAALWIAGLDDIATPRITNVGGVLAQTDDRAPTLVLSHSPDIFPRIPSSPALTLSGHTHCGQFWLPFVGRPLVPIENAEQACGFYEEDGRRLFVTAGIGTAILPFRFLTPPEIVVLDLTPNVVEGIRPGGG